MTWTAELQARFNRLRQQELSGLLNEQEKNELAQLITIIEAEEAQQLAKTMAKMEEEQTVVEARIQTIQTKNNELVKVIMQQEQLIADARLWLAEFERRHSVIQRSYTQVVGKAL